MVYGMTFMFACFVVALIATVIAAVIPTLSPLWMILIIPVSLIIGRILTRIASGE